VEIVMPPVMFTSPPSRSHTVSEDGPGLDRLITGGALGAAEQLRPLRLGAAEKTWRSRKDLKSRAWQ
jgi:hypothetical protein